MVKLVFTISYPIELIDDDRTYLWCKKITELLAETYNSVTEPFGYKVTTKTNCTTCVYNY